MVVVAGPARSLFSHTLTLLFQNLPRFCGALFCCCPTSFPCLLTRYTHPSPVSASFFIASESCVVREWLDRVRRDEYPRL